MFIIIQLLVFAALVYILVTLYAKTQRSLTETCNNETHARLDALANHVAALEEEVKELRQEVELVKRKQNYKTY